MEVNRSEVANLFKSLSGGIFSLAKRWCYIMNMIRASHATMIIVKIRWAGLVVAFQGQDRDQAETRAFFVCSRWGGSVVDCWLLWLGFVSCLCSMTNTSEKYERTQQGNLLGEVGRHKYGLKYQGCKKRYDGRQQNTLMFNVSTPHTIWESIIYLNHIVGRFPRGTGTLIEDSVLSRTETNLNIFLVLLLVSMIVLLVVVVRLMVMIENRDKSSPSPGEHDPDDDQ